MSKEDATRLGEKFVELVRLMAELRGPAGCPWDKEQTHQSLKKYAIEEAYELCEAIDQGEKQKIAEELGDVLLQVVFHAQMASEAGAFTVKDVLDSINTKLVSRHPHVFGGERLETAEEVLRTWEINKAKEKGENGSLMGGVPKSLPALLRARRVQQRAAQVGFDWKHVGEVIEKIEEELQEFRAACRDGTSDEIEGEMGDLLFAVVNVSRFLSTDPEAALHRTVAKFITRFQHIEKRVKESGRSLEQVSVEEMDRYWEEAKELGN